MLIIFIYFLNIALLYYYCMFVYYYYMVNKLKISTDRDDYQQQYSTLTAEIHHIHLKKFHIIHISYHILFY